ncbi:amino acid ABC transporter ATP-binding protein [Rhizobium leguminosarum]|jgi:polar amino acid transport system ATP-binding protein|uniref:Arginine ABC transporter ATP-binding protein n=1 Tax=Rhizobium leguminosarum bv. trifolii TaxID=386 RepID=A0A1B8R3E3_RHILT|nr:amino acid ABC transporter ATP-binding protein [Rhizobium leguminosarum]AOO94000.1 arginine ABC transporter ATP-binding protein [Rhizobium leguminosarum bv. trifolii]MBP2487982.1 polar amino acid transport system ATP-binding protein [Rhizobium leguminosarum]MBY5915283.1 amino acid ABC transporter ATP-binding protein [Rhizobium leguminosarum]MDV4162574.1 amino acid ABC transporter ATP-binding protein [Rhizobium leguminosarum]MDV4173137.1 amino acid ABC transporter ATP-binding protein [Rhizob
MNALLSVAGLRKSYGPIEVLKGIDFDVAPGEKIALIGPSGSGKSTCLRCMNFLEKPSAGEIRLDGERIGVRNGHVMSDRQLAPQRAEMGMVFQLFNLWPHLSVTENVAIAARKVRGLPAAEARELALEMLAKVHMTHRADASPLELSGGQQQRVAIARALAQKPKLMLFDEPTSALDPELVQEVLKVMEELAAEGRTMLIVTHEIAFARDIADRVLFLDGGTIAEAGPARQVITAPHEARTQAFLNKIRH